MKALNFMRTFYCTLCFILLCFSVKAQTFSSPDCRTAIPVCADMVIETFTDGRGDINDFDPEIITQIGCLEKGGTENNIENNTTWLVFRAGTGGQIGFDLRALPSSGGSVTAEWDFAVFGPDVDCASISNGSVQPIRCNYEANETDFTGIGVNPADGIEGVPSLTQNQNTYDEWLNVEPGEIYYILINNFRTNTSGDAEFFDLTFTGDAVVADQNNALDCTFRDEFLGLDIVACEGDPDIVLSALRSPAGPNIIGDVLWSVDYDDDGIIDDMSLTGIGANQVELVVSSPNTGRYFAEITTSAGTLPVTDVGGVFIEFFTIPELDADNPVAILDTNLSIDPDQNNIQFNVDGNGSYEYAINGGEFQDDPVFNDVPPGINTVIINDKNGCGITDPIEFLVIGYPKFFTPNGDFINDTWNIEGIEMLDNTTVSVFDRYGKLLRQLSASSAWDGTFNGRQMPASDYWFRFEYTEPDNGLVVAKTRRTHFTLKR